MSIILPISFVATLVCVLVAIDWALYQQILFVGAALSATVCVSLLEDWGCRKRRQGAARSGPRANSRAAPLERLAAVDGEHLAQDVAGAVAREEEDRLRDVVAVGDAARGNARERRLLVEPA